MFFVTVAARAAEPVWAELLTNGVPSELAPFYERSLGWKSERVGEGPRGAVRFLRGGRVVGGLSYRAGERGEAWRARWVLFFPMTAAAGLEQAGARIIEAGHAGAATGREQVLAADPQGAVFGLISRAEDEAPTSGFWPVLLTHNTSEAAEFYRALRGGSVVDEARTPLFRGDFLLCVEGGRAWAGVEPAGLAGRPSWLLLVAVADLDATVKMARRAGARVLRAPGIDLIGGRVAVLADPAGAVFGLCEALPLAGRPGAKSGGRGAVGETFEVEALAQ